MKSKEFIRLNLIYVLYIIGVFLAWNIIMIYFSKQGFDYIQISIYYLLFSLSSMLFILYPHSLDIKMSIKYSQMLRIASFLLVVHFFTQAQLYLTGIVLGVALELFWIPYNYRLKQHEVEDSKKLKIRSLMRLGSLLKVIVPVAGAVIASKVGFFPLFLISIFLFLLNIESSSILEEGQIRCNIIKAIKSSKGVKLMLFLEGLWQSIPFVIIPLITLRYVLNTYNESSQVFYFGLFFSYIALLSVIAYHLTRRIENKEKKHYLYPLTLAMGALAIITSFAGDSRSWVLLVGLTVLTWKIAERFTDALLQSKNIENIVVLRRFFISMGRVVGTSVTIAVIFLFGESMLELSLRMIGGAFLLYPAILRIKK